MQEGKDAPSGNDEIPLVKLLEGVNTSRAIETITRVFRAEQLHLDTSSAEYLKLIYSIRDRIIELNEVQDRSMDLRHILETIPEMDYFDCFEGISMCMGLSKIANDAGWTYAQKHAFFLVDQVEDTRKVDEWLTQDGFAMGARVVLQDLYKRRRDVRDRSMLKPGLDEWLENLLYDRSEMLLGILIPAVETIVRRAEETDA